MDLTAATQAEPLPADAGPSRGAPRTNPAGASGSGGRNAGGANLKAHIDLSLADDDDDDVVVVMTKPGTLRQASIKRPRPALPKAPPVAAFPTWAAPPPRPPSPDKETRKCPICLEKMEEMATTPCGHVFCNQCLIDCVKAQKKCPKCRKSVQLKQIHRLFMD